MFPLEAKHNDIDSFPQAYGKDTKVQYVNICSTLLMIRIFKRPIDPYTMGFGIDSHIILNYGDKL